MKPSLQEQIVTDLRRRILRGDLQAGDRLPPERELAHTLGTNRNTLREAIRILESFGLVEVRQGRGVTVRSFREEGQLTLLPFFLRDGQDLAERIRALEDVLHIRRAFLAEAVALATARSGAAVGPKLKRLYRTLEEAAATGDSERVMAADLSLYREIASASGSLTITWAFNTFDSLFRDGISQIAGLWLASDTYLQGIKRVVERIADSDGEGAREALLAHLAASDRELMDSVATLVI
ncbi:MAG: FadR family transcriptional regulator [Bradymonadales bacterium]|nr:FadR family transcriptional regulator [Bradymonadales bacterium]